MSAKSEEKSVTSVSDITASEQESGIRYAAYANRLKTILKAARRYRYVAYSSDIGESFRPVAHPYLVKSGYVISWLYFIGDISYAAWLTKRKSEGTFTPGLRPWDTVPNVDVQSSQEFVSSHSLVDSDWRLSALKRGVFQGIASMAIPALTIHNIVHYSDSLFKKSGITVLQKYGAVLIGLGTIPILPRVIDEPVEQAVDWLFYKGEQLYIKKTKLE
ncbi:uncharacterized protein SPAPADRAFT_49219 [Spathaspora passalidarum NRRL Y-27907]|uniref:Mitochondrial fission process protein 1 n=1 Tax=Spathaspora passalidarum (strain NRRL Y-27907 / 11-Y1) TaxID=619300 RepID=G3AHI7_SPAPN|nr:uncharacterized protein SPAPADRAFT_49219 [Spathaspora passalidarum NRRL Y-27907]EGW34151.1 hypothetical protein SPAPADRAFT_49219 [Spathaspora passalidarum NRRL Y-27907]